MKQRGILRLLTRGILVILLLAQWAIVSHACMVANGQRPGDAIGARVMADAAPAAGTAGFAAASMVDCASMDGMSAYTQDALCAEHCAYGDQGDRSTASALPAVFLSVAYFLKPAPEVRPLRRASASMAHALALASPPHAILHCVRRT